MIRFDNTQLHPGKITFSQFAGFGIQRQFIPANGQDGPSIFYNDAIELNAAPTDEFMAVLLTVPAVGIFNLYEDGSFDFTGAPDGVYYATYEGFRNGVSYGVFTITLTIGSAGTIQDITVSNLQQTTELSPVPVSLSQMVSVSDVQQLTQINQTSVSVLQVVSIPATQQLNQLAPVNVTQNIDTGTVQQITTAPVQQLTELSPITVSVSQMLLVSPVQQLTQSVLVAIYGTQNIQVSPVQQLTQLVLVTEQVPESINPFYIKLTVLPSPFTLSR